MNDFKYYLETTGEVGYVSQSRHSIVHVSGLPQAKPHEIVLFETGEVGEVLSLSLDYLEILNFSNTSPRVGTKVARTDELFKISVGEHLFGKTVDPLALRQTSSTDSAPQAVSGQPPSTDPTTTSSESSGLGQLVESRPIDIAPKSIGQRAIIDEPLETGVTMVDLVISLGKGQRELVVGDRKTGKSSFLWQVVLAQVGLGTVCIYAAVAKKRLDIKKAQEFFRKQGIEKKVITVATSSTDPSGLIFVTPYVAMTIAEYFRDKGRDTLVIIDDLSTHAKAYREIALLARRFPGRSSYPGDIFYIHSRLLERAGKFKVDRGEQGDKEVSISCLPVAELVMGDLSAYIPTNLMSMTDGHIFFDIDLYNEGKRPPINPFLSVTRAGRQTQTPLLRDLSRQLTSFLVRVERLKQFMHFGAELGETTRRTLSLGDRVAAFFDEGADVVIPVNANVILLAALWAGFWKDTPAAVMKKKMAQIIATYKDQKAFAKQVDDLIASSESFKDLVRKIRENNKLLTL